MLVGLSPQTLVALKGSSIAAYVSMFDPCSICCSTHSAAAAQHKIPAYACFVCRSDMATAVSNQHTGFVSQLFTVIASNLDVDNSHNIYFT